MDAANRILIVDSYPLFRSTLRSYLSQEPDFHVVGVAGSMRDAIWSVASLAPDVVLTDLAMPDARGVEAVSGIKRHFPEIKVLVLSFHCEPEFKQKCLEVGAAGYVVKDSIHEELCDGIRSVLRGEPYLGSGLPSVTVPNYLRAPAESNSSRRPVTSRLAA